MEAYQTAKLNTERLIQLSTVLQLSPTRSEDYRLWLVRLYICTLSMALHHFEKEMSMKQGTKDEVKGKIHEVKGKVKEKVGRATNDPNLVADGQDEHVAGKVQKKVGQVEKVLGE